MWAQRNQFLEHNVWYEQRVGEVDRVREQVDFLGLRVAYFVEQTAGCALGSLLIAFVYLAVQSKRIDKRLAEIETRLAEAERRLIGEKPT